MPGVETPPPGVEGQRRALPRGGRKGRGIRPKAMDVRARLKPLRRGCRNDALREAGLYSAESTRVLAAKYAAALCKASLCIGQSRMRSCALHPSDCRLQGGREQGNRGLFAGEGAGRWRKHKKGALGKLPAGGSFPRAQKRAAASLTKPAGYTLLI